MAPVPFLESEAPLLGEPTVKSEELLARSRTLVVERDLVYHPTCRTLEVTRVGTAG
jgi:hypothetical protein